MERSLLQIVDHRPWALPASPWLMRQTWHDLLFAHWPVRPESLRAVVPPELELNLWEGSAWLGVVPFHMSGIRLHGFWAIPGLSAFPELNVRTYVKAGGRSGVYFFSLDAANAIAVACAQRFFLLPYYRAKMQVFPQGNGLEYHSTRIHRGAMPVSLEARYKPMGEVFQAQPGGLEHWLTERYCLFTLDRRRKICQCEIHPSPWPLQPAEAEFMVNQMTEAIGIALEGEPLLHFVRRLDVLIWPLRSISTWETHAGLEDHGE